MLSIVTEPNGDVVYVHADSAGIVELEAAVARLKKRLLAGDCPHDHLMSASWGGGELSETMLAEEQGKGCRQVHHITLYGWNEEWARKHGLKKI